ncbi:hypothetical protein [Curvivirga aplysinae]|uniref:hypothetical protein n=1 Tax=Curvivirga aplysinae TaxID=2529852 RepID=UPI0012BD39D5|nr:hypothetical protein [Curvivirga aplysinae]MTI08698.1 hypothetical protein [Curvivirga aplysinae]
MSVKTQIPDQIEEVSSMSTENPRNLRDIVPDFGGVDPEKAFAEIDEVFLELKNEYADKLGEDIMEIERLTSLFEKDNDIRHLDAVYSIVHNMRGQGGSFDFPLISAIGTSFCKYAANRKDKENYSFPLILQHLEAIKLVYKENRKGEGDQTARAVVNALAQAVDILLEKEKNS